MAEWRFFTERDWHESGFPRAALADCWNGTVIEQVREPRILAAPGELRRNIETLDYWITKAPNRGRFEHGTEGKLPRGHTKRTYRLTERGAILSALCLHHSQVRNCCEVQAFLAADVPGLPPLAAAEAGLLFLLCDSVKSGGSLAIQFSDKCSRGIPAVLREVAARRKVLLSMADRGMITPEESRDLFLALTPISEAARTVLRRLDGRGVLSRERGCYLVHHGIWPACELDLVLTLSPHPELVLGNAPDPGVGHLHRHAAEHARMAILVGHLMRSLTLRSPVPSEDCKDWFQSPDDYQLASLESLPAWQAVRIHSPESLVLEGWSTTDETGRLRIPAQCGISVLPRPRSLPSIVPAWDADIAAAAQLPGEVKALAVTFEIALLPADQRLRLLRSANQAGVRVLVCPFNLAALETEVRRRNKLVRHLRR